MRFEVGEIAIIHGPSGKDGSNYNGTECEIVRCGMKAGEFVRKPVWCGVSGMLIWDHDYEVRLCDGLHATVEDEHLRKKRPPIPDEVLTIFETRKRTEPA